MSNSVWSLLHQKMFLDHFFNLLFMLRVKVDNDSIVSFIQIVCKLNLTHSMCYMTKVKYLNIRLIAHNWMAVKIHPTHHQ